MTTFFILFISLFSFAEPLPPISEHELQSRVKILTQAPYKGGATLKAAGEDEGCSIYNLSYPVQDPFSKKVITYKMKFSMPRSETPVPVILVVPTIVGITRMEKAVIKQMCQKNVAAIMAHVNNEGIDLGPTGAVLADQQLMRGAVALRTLMDVLEKLSEINIDTKRVGLVGLSIGSVSSQLAMAVDERFKGLFIMGAIGNSPHALAFSENDQVARLRKAQMKYKGFDDPAQYEIYLRSMMKATPVEFAPLLAKRNVYQVIIENDVIAPTSGQYEIQVSTQNKNVYFDRTSLGHGVALSGEIIVNQHHLPRFLTTEIFH